MKAFPREEEVAGDEGFSREEEVAVDEGLPGCRNVETQIYSPDENLRNP